MVRAFVCTGADAVVAAALAQPDVNPLVPDAADVIAERGRRAAGNG